MLYGQWLRTGLSTRQAIAAQFGIAKVSATHVSNDVVVDDGYKVHDIETALHQAVLEDFLGAKGTLEDLFTLLVDRIEGRNVVKRVSTEPIAATAKETVKELAEPNGEVISVLNSKPVSAKKNKSSKRA